MKMLINIMHGVDAVRRVVWPTYQPERHYMRGPGPACARRTQLH